MNDFIADIQEPVFVFQLVDYPGPPTVDMSTPSSPVMMTNGDVGVYAVNNQEEIRLLMAAAQEALNNQ